MAQVVYSIWCHVEEATKPPRRYNHPKTMNKGQKRLPSNSAIAIARSKMFKTILEEKI
jgi:hypothetical protein